MPGLVNQGNINQGSKKEEFFIHFMTKMKNLTMPRSGEAVNQRPLKHGRGEWNQCNNSGKPSGFSLWTWTFTCLTAQEMRTWVYTQDKALHLYPRKQVPEGPLGCLWQQPWPWCPPAEDGTGWGHFPAMEYYTAVNVNQLQLNKQTQKSVGIFIT